MNGEEDASSTSGIMLSSVCVTGGSGRESGGVDMNREHLKRSLRLKAKVKTGRPDLPGMIVGNEGDVDIQVSRQGCKIVLMEFVNCFAAKRVNGPEARFRWVKRVIGMQDLGIK